MKDFIKNICQSNSQNLIEFGNSNFLIESFEIDCSLFGVCNNGRQVMDVKIQSLLDNLKQIKGPVVYWIEIANNITGKQLFASFSEYSDKKLNRAIPAIKKNPNLDSNILYVGKVKNGFWGRIITHLGYHEKGKYPGLQLYFWTGELNLVLKVNYCRFSNELSDLLPLFEVSLARKFKPIIGKHK